jgi:FtsH-binding integral membrane protein
VDERKWPVWARVAVTLLLLPVWAAAILAAENDLSGLGTWFDLVMVGLMAVIIVAAWVTTRDSQR